MTEPKLKYAFFIPYKGDNYSNGINGKKVLVLGASFYCEDTLRSCHKYCTSTVKKDSSKYDLMCPKYEVRTDENGKPLRISNEPSNIDADYTAYLEFQKLITAATGIDEMWKHIVFTNYIQFYLPSKDTKKEYFTERDYLAFIEVVQHHEYDPDVIIVWGKPVREELQRRLPETCKSIEKMGHEDRVWRVRFVDRERVLVFTHHPICASKNKKMWNADFGKMTENIKIALQ